MHKIAKVFVYIIRGLAIIAFFMAIGCLLEYFFKTDFFKPVSTAALFTLAGGILFGIASIVNE